MPVYSVEVKHHRRALLTALAVSTAAALAAPPAMTHADPPDAEPSAADTNAAEPQRAERFEGTWRLEQSNDEAQQVVAEAVEDAANQFNFVIRGIARSRLRAGTPIHSRVHVSFDGDQVTVRFGNESYTTELGRTEVRQNPQGEDMRVTQRIRPNGQLEQVFETEGGTRRYVYTPLSDGRMRIATTTDSPQMPQPMYFMLDYRRAA